MAEVLTQQLSFGRYKAGYGTDGAQTRALIWIQDIGPELVLNGDFSTTANWDLTGGTAVISGGTLNMTETVAATEAAQGISFVAGKTYRLVYTISNYTSGDLTPVFGGGANTSLTDRTSNGTFTEDAIAGSGNFVLRFNAGSGGFHGSIDNVSLKQVN